MRKMWKALFFSVLIILSISIVVENVDQISKNDPNFTFDLETICKQFFVYHSSKDDFFREFNIVSIICYFSTLLFGFFAISIALFGVSTGYRRMILIRYHAKRKFLRIFILKGIVSSAFVTMVFLIGFFISIWLYGPIAAISKLQIAMMCMRFCNLFLFFNLLVLLNIYSVIRFENWVSIVMVGTLMGFVLILDMFVIPVSFLTYGETLKIEITSTMVQTILYGTGSFLLNRSLKYAEL